MPAGTAAGEEHHEHGEEEDDHGGEASPHADAVRGVAARTVFVDVVSDDL